MVDATVLSIEKEEANGHVFNVGTGIPVTVKEVVQALIKNYGIEVPVQVTGDYRLGDIRHNYACLEKIKRLLGFKPGFSFEKGVELFTDWVNNQAIKESKYEDSIKEMREKGLMK